MIRSSKYSILLLGLHKIHSEIAKKRILQEPYNFLNALEIKLNKELKNDVVGVLIISSSDDVQLIYDLPNLRAISCNSSGMDYLDLEKLHSRSISVKNCPDVTADATSDVALILIMQMARKISTAIQANHNPSLYNNSLNEYMGNDIRNKTLGIIGLGSIGQCLAYKTSMAFGMKIVYHQRNKRPSVLFPYYENLIEMLPVVDFLVISCPLTSSTKHLINLDRIKFMKPTAYIINIARGSIIKTNDLLEALRCGIIAGAGLDVTDPEPLPSSHPLLHMNNVTILPHIGTFTSETSDKMIEKTLENLRVALEIF